MIALADQNWYTTVSRTFTYEQVSRRIEVEKMNRRRADTVAGALVAAVLIVGGVLTWQAYQQQQAFEQMGSMMGTSMGAVHGTNPLLYVLGTLLLSAVVGGGYLVVRDEFTTTEVTDRSQTEMANPTEPESIESQDGSVQSEGKANPESQPQARVLDLLPDDERRILEPVLSSPGITQIELRDRSNFSKSKVSQTVSALEKRGLLYRERQGRTYRIYPSDDLQQKQAN
ncbi:hypothetical protein C474_13839 [Halogeometricum pallidum JCM 14848]|uniref:DUF7343 domain-containing protein n=2 Tax=Halogeometricum TaxID=60846 RepID=M0D2E3_HALPD|nr:hypothetical protein C474_13839 [Halogeometricum pallidum JCM 14848]